MTENTTPSSNRKLLIGSAAAIGIAAVALVVFVLPAEYGIDPTGAGKALGVTKLNAPAEEENIYLKRGQARTNVMFPLKEGAKPDEATLRATLAEHNIAERPGTPVRTDRFVFELAPYEAIELKYDMAEGAPVIFSWSATAPVHLDMHSHPFEGGEEATESFVINDSLPSQSAVYVAPYDGIHGWYWQNRNLDGVTVTLEATGQMTASRIFNQAGEHPRPLSDEATPSPDAASGETAAAQ
ncbi:MAG TPA: hypothetical protein VNR60_10420 [Croceibacterium sp.]|nr:hypothetical protein [Croceibacterium sp.]